MPKLYLGEYKKSLSGSDILVACREGILRNHLDEIIHDLKFIQRQGINVTLVHTLPNRFANRKHFRYLVGKLPDTEIIRTPIEAGEDFYEFTMSLKERIEKIIFVERKYLTDDKGRKINSITTKKIRRMIDEQKIMAYGDLINNMNFKDVMDSACQRIESGAIGRVHIVPAGRRKIMHELFSIEGTGTMIANDFNEALAGIRTGNDVDIVCEILKKCRKDHFIKPRSKAYISANRNNFFIAEIDGIPVGCAERIHIDKNTAELGALAVSSKYRSQMVGLFLIESFIQLGKKDGYGRILSMTNNPKLGKILTGFGFEPKTPDDLRERQERSPNVAMFVYEF